LKVLLIHTPKTHQVWAGVPDVFNDRHAYLFPPLAVMGLSSYLKANTHHTVDVLDGVVDNLNFDDITTRVRASQPDVVGISATATHTLVNVAKSIKAVRAARPDIKIIMGGAHVTAFPELAARLPGIDLAIQGDGEEPLAQVLDALESDGPLEGIPGILIPRDDGTVYANAETFREENLDNLPFPDREACPPGKYFTPGMRGARTTTMMGSRGCPSQCTFCNVPHKYRARSPESVVEEMAECVNRHGIQDIHFLDDIFNLTADRVMAISELILSRGLKIWWGYKSSVRNTTREMVQLAKRAGCYRIHFGVETFTDAGLKALRKTTNVDQIEQVFRMTREEGVKPIAYMIIACPHEKSVGEILPIVSFVQRLRPAYVVFSLFTPYPDAPIFKVGAEKGLYPADIWEKWMLDPTEFHDLPTAWEEHMTKAELLSLFKTVNRKFYLDPRTLARTFTGIQTVAELKHVLLGGFQLARMEMLKADSRRI
jgi:anaerobic magnesium-protoporphyrin IX monomethyl ester cyclase